APAARDAGAATGFALALSSLLRKEGRRPEKRRAVCWIGTADLVREAGFPYAPGLKRVFGLPAHDLLFCAAGKLADALWIAEEASRLDDFAAVVLEIRGNPARLDLTATRRLNRRAQERGRPVFLIRAASFAEPTAAPVRFHVSSTPAVPRSTLSGALEDSIGHPAFTVAIGKSPTSLPGEFVLEWNPDVLAFHEIRPAHPRALVPAPAHRPHLPAAGGTVVALRRAGEAPAPGDQSSREERPAHPSPRRAG
ncbi:ImuA family protein, partial [Nitratireductor sp. GCM10026969]|uniref:ImuA family protein n=1 Tax=Nitratireductor sp. GCM10026969 TaxID=3252645 RepID=UPI0036117D22